MSFVVIFVSIMVVLFALAFVTKRRFGVLGLALVAGAMLSNLWADTLTPLVAHTGVTLTMPPLAAVVAAGLIVLPAILLLMSGPTYHKMPHRIVGSLAFALLGVTLLLDPLGSALVIDGIGRSVYDSLVQYHVAIITAAMIAALLDIITTKTPKPIAKH